LTGKEFERFLFCSRRVFLGVDKPALLTRAEERKPIAMSILATMRALQQTSLNGPQDLRLITDVPVPVPRPGEVLIQVTAAGVNFGDISQAHGTFLGGPQPPPTWRASRPPARSPLAARQ
jgi:hypothetical protein